MDSCALNGGIGWLVRSGLAAVLFSISSIGVGVRAQSVSFLVQDTLVDSTAAVLPGTFAMIYLDNQLMAQGADTLILRWQIDTVFGTIDSLLAGFCTEICYPTTVTGGVEIVAPGGKLPLKGYFMPEGSGFVDTGWAVMRIRLWDSLNPQSVVVVTYFLRLQWQVVTSTGWGGGVGSEDACLRFQGQGSSAGHVVAVAGWGGLELVNRCPYPVRFYVVNGAGQCFQRGIVPPYGRFTLSGVQNVLGPVYFYLVEERRKPFRSHDR